MDRWIIVSNRLPFSYDADSQKLKTSSGGLVTAISGIKTNNEILWVGSTANSIPDKIISDYNKKNLMNFSPVVIDENLFESYYNDFCNDVLWPILHYELEYVKYRDQAWDDYVKVNHIFAEKILEISDEKDMIWIHDFHLFLVPEILKKANPKLKIGFFLHVPFPSSEIYRQLPCRKEILKSLIHCDLVGFHDYSYLRHFTSSVYNVLGIHTNTLEVKMDNHLCKLGVYPVSIDTQDFVEISASKQTSQYLDEYTKSDNGIKYLLGVDRLDYTKGIKLKLLAFKYLLEHNPDLVGKVQLLQIAVPSRVDVSEYIQLRSDVERLVGEINGKFSTMDYTPVKYIFNSVNKFELLALYQRCEVLFISSKRDGMNLVCLEYIASQIEDNPGVVLLSEFAGAASTLSHILRINPMNIKDTSENIKLALNMPKDERIKRNKIMLSFLKGYTATDWAKSFIRDLGDRRAQFSTKTIDIDNKINLQKLLAPLKKNRTTLLLDYDGTLAPIVNSPDDARMNKLTRETIESLSTSEKFDVVIVSGRHVKFLKEQFDGINLYIAGEHGGIFYDFQRDRWRILVSTGQNVWYEHAMEVFESYAKRTPNSFIEKKDYAICWHYRNSPKDFAEFQARKLVVDLEAALTNLPVNVVMGKKVVEVKAVEANKGYFAHWFIERYVEDDQNIIAIGDDRTDEDMFKALGPNALTIKVGSAYGTNAKYNINNQEDVIKLLTELSLE